MKERGIGWWGKGTLMLGLCVGMSCGLPGTARAQSLADDIEQLTLDYQKLAQMKTILSDMKTAYTIVHKGYEDIKGIAQGNFNLHEAFLDGLQAVSPLVKNYAKVANIISNEATLVKEYKSAQSYFNKDGHFSSDELSFFSNLYGNLLAGSLKNINELTMVITANQLRMSDAERLSAIDRIDRDMSDKLDFLREFNNAGAMQAGQRTMQQSDAASLKSIYGLSNGN